MFLLKITRFILIVAAVCLLAPSKTNASTITFDPLESSGDGITNLTSYSELGFNFINLTQPGYPWAFGSAQQNYGYAYAGSAGLYNGTNNGVTQLRAGDGSAFSLHSIDLSRLWTNQPGSTTVLFVGVQTDGNAVSQSFTFNQFGFQTFTFDSSFVNLSYVNFAYQLQPGFQFDNVVVNVPEPASLFS